MKRYFSVFEILLWFFSSAVIVFSFFISEEKNYLALIASMIGVSSLIFVAKGNPVGHVLGLIFSALYGIISYWRAYYGEMITYLGMTAPMAFIALIAWLKHPFRGKKSQVEIRNISGKEWLKAAVLTMAITAAFYFILNALSCADLQLSTLSVATSFFAVYLTFRRSPYYALAYASNDVVLVILWTIAAVKDPSYFSVVACFAVFLINDLYGFFNWKKMQTAQYRESEEDAEND